MPSTYALVFGVGPDHFFSQDDRAFAVVCGSDRQRSPQTGGGSLGSFYFESLDYSAKERRLNAFLAVFRAVAIDDVKLHRHAGAEFIYVLEGELGLYIRHEENTLAKGDSVYFDSSQLHGYRRVGRKECRAIVVIVPGRSHQA